MHVFSNSKINLFLDIENKRKDNYHNIITVFQEISLFDEIWIKPIKKNTILVKSNNQEISGEKNIVYKIAEYLKIKYKIPKGCEIKIKKNIPIGAGLGGGSGNGAAVLSALNKMWKINMDKNQLLKIAAKFGSDIPFFLVGKTSIGEGRGEILTPLMLNKKYFVVLTYPDLFVSTEEIYKRAKFYLTKFKKRNIIEKIKYCILNNRLEEVIFNRLEGIVFENYPIVLEIKNFFKNHNAVKTAMSGSGSTVYTLLETRKEATSLISKFREKYDFPIWLAETIN